MSEISHLVAALKSNALSSTSLKAEDIRLKLVENVVYHVPRLTNGKELFELIDTVFNSKVWGSGDYALRLYDMSRSFVHWKLQISEPTISISKFYEILNYHVIGCQRWDLNKLSMLAGILSTKQEFVQLNNRYFIDDKGSVATLYQNWKLTFINIWNGLLWKYKQDNKLRLWLVLIYAPINDARDDIPWNIVVISLINLLTIYIFGESNPDFDFLDRNINNVSRAIQLGTSKCDDQLVSNVLNRFCKSLYDLSMKEQALNRPREQFRDTHYSNILLTAVMFFKSVIDSRNGKLSDGWKHQIIICLYYIHFISREFGTIGFKTYEYVYRVSVTGLVMSSHANPQLYFDVLDLMRASIWESNTNAIQQSRVLFLIEFLEFTEPILSDVPQSLLLDRIEPIIEENLHHPNIELRETTNIMVLTLIGSQAVGVDWKLNFIENYLISSFDAYISDKLSRKQLLIINKAIAKTIVDSNNDTVSNDVLSFILALTARDSTRQQRLTIQECLIYHLIHVPPQNQIAWMNRCYSIIDRDDRNELLPAFWDVVTKMKSDQPIHWWYEIIVNQSSRF